MTVLVGMCKWEYMVYWCIPCALIWSLGNKDVLFCFWGIVYGMCGVNNTHNVILAILHYSQCCWILTDLMSTVFCFSTLRLCFTHVNSYWLSSQVKMHFSQNFSVHINAFWVTSSFFANTKSAWCFRVAMYMNYMGQSTVKH